jgi:asparagine synthase (glutamine-hydrolysing)
MNWRFNGGLVAKICSRTSQCTGVAELGETEQASWVVEGKILEKDSYRPASAASLVAAALREPTDVPRRFWGDYFIIIYDKRNDQFLALCDPCGQHPVFFHCEADGSVHIGDSIKDFVGYGAVVRAVDQKYLAQYLAYGYGEATRTGWRDISFLAPGTALVSRRGRSPMTLRAWSPRDGGEGVSRRDFADLLTSTLAAALEPDRPILLELSGGLDSTAIAVALRRADLHQRVLAVTYFDPQRAASNEVSVARIVARRCGMEHKAYSLLDCLPFSPPSALPLVAKPATKLCFLAQQEHFVSSGTCPSSSIIVNGHGGDSLYLAPPPFSAIVDAVANMRFSRAVSSLRDLSIHYRVPIWHTLRRAWSEARDFFVGAGEHAAMALIQPEQRPSLGAGLYDDVLCARSLWLRPGKRCQIVALGAIIDDSQIQPRPDGARPVMPFFFQPVVEHALQLRTEDLFSTDHSRLPVRQSVYDVSGLPTLWREEKGDIMHSALLGVRANEHYFRDICMGGWCVSEGIVNPDRLDRAIRRTAIGYGNDLATIMRVYSTEIFVRGLLGDA